MGTVVPVVKHFWVPGPALVAVGGLLAVIFYRGSQLTSVCGPAGVPPLSATRRPDRLLETPLHRPGRVPVVITGYEILPAPDS
ncbi:hypothetical protein [Streptomyces blattellae]|uniref:hypothetical protein n=1 Tax=Streptomyces blattellae TaxID=2569855 RepID=UPI0012B81536|nr:hypothetical protein [Streptomyces blattellae]